MLVRSARGASSCDRLGGFIHSDAFAGQRRLVRAQAVSLDQACIRRDLLAVRQYQDVAWDDFRRVDLLVCSIAQDSGLEHQQPVQRLQLLLGAVFFEEAQSDTQDDDTQDEVSGQPASAFPREGS